MTQEQAEIIAYAWHYDNEYSFYDMEADQEDLEEFLDDDKRGNTVFAVSKNDELVAFLSVYQVDTKTVDIGLGMRPDLTDQGGGIKFITDAMEFIAAKFKPEKVTLSVATFNKRAIKVYRKVGFSDLEVFIQDTNGSTFEFLKMEYIC